MVNFYITLELLNKNAGVKLRKNIVELKMLVQMKDLIKYTLEFIIVQYLV